MFQGNENRKNMQELLWIKINNAILKSEEVQNLIMELERTGKLDAVSQYNLVIDVGVLIEAVLKLGVNTRNEEKFLEKLKEKLFASFEEENLDPDSSFSKIPNIIESKETRSNPPLSSGKNFQRIDGEKDFDEEAWLKKARIRFDL